MSYLNPLNETTGLLEYIILRVLHVQAQLLDLVLLKEVSHHRVP